MGDHPDPGLVFALALGAGVAAQLVAHHLRVPGIVVLLAAGLVLGPDFLGWVEPQALGEGLRDLVSLAVAVILFEGALSLDLERIRRAQSAIRMLVSVGAAVTAVGGTLAARWIMEWDWGPSLLFGTLVIVTGPTVIKPLLRNVPLRRRLATVVEAEGVFIDPVGAIVAAVALEVVVHAEASVGFGIPSLAARMGFGAVAGLVGGLALGFVLRRDRLVPEGLENLVTLGGVLVLFAGCNAVLEESGILAVTVAGVVMGNMKQGPARGMQGFEELLTIGLVGLLFVLLAADVRLADVRALGMPGVATVLVLMAVVRPLNVLVSTATSDLDPREKGFLAWTAPRGIVAAAAASLAALLMDRSGMQGGAALRALVFLTIAITVVVQGGGAAWVSRLLRVRAPGRETLAILGADELGLALGEELGGGEAVVFVDSNHDHCHAAEDRGFPAIFGNALDERVLVRARLDRCRAAIGLTANAEINSLFAREARDDFGVPETYVAVGRTEGVPTRILEKQASRMLFDGPKDVERWNVRFRHGAVELASFRFAEPREDEEAPAPVGSLDAFVILLLERGGARQPMHAELEPRAGDLARVAIYGPEAPAARGALARAGWLPAGEEVAAAEA